MYHLAIHFYRERGPKFTKTLSINLFPIFLLLLRSVHFFVQVIERFRFRLEYARRVVNRGSPCPTSRYTLTASWKTHPDRNLIACLLLARDAIGCQKVQPWRDCACCSSPRQDRRVSMGSGQESLGIGTHKPWNSSGNRRKWPECVYKLHDGRRNG